MEEEFEVRFDLWCEKCAHYETTETGDPCNHCLDNPVNENSSVPVDYKEP